MSSLNQAFIKAYGKDAPVPAAPAAPQAATVTAPAPPVVQTAVEPSAKVLGSWYSADTWFRAESAHAPPAAATAPATPSAPVAPPHVAFTAGYQAPSSIDLGNLQGVRVARHLAEETEYSLLPAEPIAKPELVVIDEPVKMIAPPMAVVEAAPPAPVVAPAPVAVVAAPEVPAPVVAPVAPLAPPSAAKPALAPSPPAPIAPRTAPVADAFSLHDMFAPMQVVGGWEATIGVIPPVSTLPATAAPVVKTPTPKSEVVATKPAEKPIVKPAESPTPLVNKAPEVVVAPAPAMVAPPTRPTVATAPSVPQMRLDAAMSSPVPKPHVALAPIAPVITPPAPVVSSAPSVAAPPAPAPVITAPPPLKVEAPAPVIKAPPAIAPVIAPAAAPMAPPAPAPVAKALPSGPIQPAWEVDRFQFPEHCQQLMTAESKYMSDVGQRLSIASKDGLSILAITSTRRGEGRTTLALCLAKAAAAAGVKVALVDGDGDNPQLVNELGVEASCGWHDVVQGKQPLAEAAILSVEDKFTFFPWTTTGALKSLNDPQVTRVLKAIASEHQLVILDLGPAPGRETRLFEDGENCPIDAAILVRDVRWTSALEAQRVAGQLQTAGVGSVGLAENFGPRTSQAS